MAQQYKVTRYQDQTQGGGKELLTKISTAIAQGRFLTIDSNGYVIEVVPATTSKIIGVSMEAKASSVATTDPILIDYCKRGDRFRVTLDSGSSAVAATAQAIVGTTVDVAATGGIDAGTTTRGHVYVWSMTAFAPARVGDATTEILVSVNLGL